MKNIIILTNSEYLANKFKIHNVHSDPIISNWISENYERMNEERLDLLKIGLNVDSCREDIFILMVEQNKIGFTGDIIGGAVIGYNECGWSFVERFKFAMKSLSIAPEQQGKGYSKEIIYSIFNFFDSNSIPVLKQSLYTQDGIKKIKNNFDKIAKEYQKIEFVSPE